METVLLRLLYRLNSELMLKIPKKQLRTLLLGHHSYPSIFSLSSTLTSLGIENKSGKISVESLLKLSPLFLAHTLQDGLVLIKDISKSQIKYFTDNSRNPITESLDTFLLKWSGVVLLFDEKPNIHTSKNISSNRIIRILKQIGVIVFLFISSLLLLNGNFGMYRPFFITKLVGVFLSILIIITHASKINQLSFCEASKKVDCNDVLNSSASKIFSWLSASDLGLVYFVGSGVSLLLGAISGNLPIIVPLLSLFALFTFPYVFFSIYYQYKVIKKWCLLCLYIQAILTLEAIISSYYLWISTLQVPTDSIIIIGMSFLVTVLTWSHLKNPIAEFFKFQANNYKYLRLKNNPDVFELLQGRKNVHETSFEGNSIELNPTPILGTTTTLVINPFCPLCAEKIENLSTHGVRSKFLLVFAASKENNISKLLIELYYKVDPDVYINELNFWFKTKRINHLANKYNLKITDRACQILRSHLKWCAKNNILKTPLTIYNNRELSEHYDIQDLLVLKSL